MKSFINSIAGKWFQLLDAIRIVSLKPAFGQRIALGEVCFTSAPVRCSVSQSVDRRTSVVAAIRRSAIVRWCQSRYRGTTNGDAPKPIREARRACRIESTGHADVNTAGDARTGRRFGLALRKPVGVA